MLGAAAGFGTIGIFGKVAAAIDFGLATLLPVRFILATLLVTGLALARNWNVPQSRRMWLATLLLGAVYTAMTLCFFIALRYLTAGLATIVVYTYPTIVVVLSVPLLGEAVTARKLLALVLATSGVVLVVGGGTAVVAPAGIAFALGSAVCYACYTTGSRMLSPVISPRALLVGVLVGTTLSMLVFGLVDGGLALPTGRDEWGVVLGLTGISTVVPLLLFYEGVSRLEASRVGVVSTVEPVVTFALGAALLGEPVTLVVVAGGVLVLSGVLLVQSRSSTSGAVQEPPAIGDTGD